MAKKNYDELAKSILELVGSSDNVSETYHCMTRLRFNLKDKGQVNVDGIKELAEVVGAQWSGDQLQIIIGQEVGDVYASVCKVGGFKEESAIDENLDVTTEKKKFKITDIF